MSKNPTGLFSVSYAGLWGQAALSARDFVGKAAALGYKSVLLMAKRPHFDAVGEGSRDGGDSNGELLAALEETGVGLIGLACYTDALLAGAAEIPVRDMQLCYLESSFKAAEFLGASLVRVFTGYIPAGMSYFRARSECVNFLREAGALAAKRGLTLAVQNHHDLAVDTESLERLLDDIGLDSVKAGFDAWSPHLRGEDLYASARRMAPRTALSIAADYRRIPQWKYEPALVNYRRTEPDAVAAVAMGSGEIDYASFYRGLSEGGYRGPVVYEMCSPLEGGPSESNLDEKANGFLTHFELVWPERGGES